MTPQPANVLPLREPELFTVTKGQWDYMVERVQRLERLLFQKAPKLPPAMRPESVAFVNAIAAEAFRRAGILEQFIFSSNTNRRYSQPRHVALYVAYYRAKDATNEALAQVFHKKSASTVSCAVRAVQDRMDVDSSFARDVQSLMDWAEKWKPQ